MQLIEGQTAQPFNRRKLRHGAFWQDRYHATAVDTGEHLARCLVYIDLNMVRAGVVKHPAQWEIESVAVGRREFVESVQRQLGERGRYREITQVEDVHVLREAAEP